MKKSCTQLVLYYKLLVVGVQVGGLTEVALGFFFVTFMNIFVKIVVQLSKAKVGLELAAVSMAFKC